MTESGGGSALRMRRAAIAVATAALIMGLPTLRGGFVGGDDHRLVLDHLLVNHPSFEHAVDLFRIVHRDLYQPLPLLTFQMEFLAAKILGLYSLGAESFAWFFHLSNVLIHAVNSLLVFHLLRRLHEGVLTWRWPKALSLFTAKASRNDRENLVADGSRSGDSSVNFTALVGALLFAIHPLEVETIAWVNGRMMLLSTFFLLACILTFMRWMNQPRWIWAVLALLCALLSALSKVRAGLPIFLILAMVIRGRRPDLRTIALWVGCGLITAAFVVVNIGATSAADLFEEGAEHLKGPRMVRILMALAWYAQHFVWPSGLTSYYPTPPEVFWRSAATLRAVLTVIAAGIVLYFAARRLRCGPWAILWFFLGIGDTLPIVPARNALAADRYMYLPIIGLAWISAEFICRVRSRIAELHSTKTQNKRPSPLPLSLGGRGVASMDPNVVLLFRLAGLAIAAGCIAQSWHVEATYNTSLAKTYRVAEVFPNEPRVWEFYGWSLHARGRYQEAIEIAKKELIHDHARVRSGAYQLMGMSELKLGHGEEALRLLYKSIEVDARNALGLYRLGMACEELGRIDEAIESYEKAVEIAPLSNPTLHRLAGVYAQVDRLDDARKAYEHELVNNPYEVPAILGLADLDIRMRTAASLKAAADRLRGLLQWMPENAVARVNLGVALNAQGQRDDAVREYEKAVSLDPKNATATINLGQVLAAQNRVGDAAALFQRASDSPDLTLDQALVIHDFLVDHDMIEPLEQLWGRFSFLHGVSREVRGFAAWSAALVGHTQDARKRFGEPGDDSPLQHAVFASAALQEADYSAAISNVESLAGCGDSCRDVRRRMIAALEFFDRHHAGTPWAFCLATPLLMADGQIDAGRVFLDQCGLLCGSGLACEYAAELRKRLENRLSREAP